MAWTTNDIPDQSGRVTVVTGANGVRSPITGNLLGVEMNALTVSGSTADSKFLLVNVTTGAFRAFTWTKTEVSDTATFGTNLPVTLGDKLALVQWQEDGTTELADAFFQVWGVAT